MNLSSRKKLIAVLTDPQLQMRTLTVAICLLAAAPVFVQAGTGRSACAMRSGRQRDFSARRAQAGLE